MSTLSSRVLMTLEDVAEKARLLHGVEKLRNFIPYDIEELGLSTQGSEKSPVLIKTIISKDLPSAIVSLKNGKSFECSANHLVVTNNGVKEVDSLQALDCIVTDEGEIEVDSVNLTGATKTFYDIGVGGDQLFYCSQGILHHNTGKTWNVQSELKKLGLSDGEGYFKIAGTASASGIYTLLYKYRDSVILFDDADGAASDQDARNILKAATDTQKVRKLVWMKKGKLKDPEEFNDDDLADGFMPSHFEFAGKVIFISNLHIDKLDPDGALRTRALMISIDPTDEEVINFMKKICRTMELEEGLYLDTAARLEVVEMIAKGKGQSLNLRKLVRGLNIRAGLENSGDSSNWARLIKLYA